LRTDFFAAGFPFVVAVLDLAFFFAGKRDHPSESLEGQFRTARIPCVQSRP
jgi:hypothetical protein